MFRKTIALIVGLSVFLSMSLVSFSLYEQTKTVTNAELESSFEIIEPKIKLKKQLYIRDNLLVSISLSEEFDKYQIPVEMNLYALDEFVELASGSLSYDSVLKEQISLNNVEFRETIKVNLNALNSRKISQVYSDLSGYKTYLDDVLKLTRSNIVNLNIVDMSTVKKDSDKINEKTKENVDDSKTKFGVSDAEKLKEIQKVAAKEKEKSATLISLYEKVLVEIDRVEKELNRIEKVYNSLFERQVDKSVLVEKSGLLPYFKYTYEEIDAGKYRLEFIRNDNEVTVKTVDFSINKKSQLTEEKIKENIIESLNILYNN
ncbi:MAG: hypothetical protein WBA54_09885 [Acidaminobacteraceae bacterium]